MHRFSLCLFVFGLCASLSAQNINVVYRGTIVYAGQTCANVWGYAAGGNEYALVGASLGLSIVNVTNPDAPTQIVQIPGPNNLWKEIKTYSHYAYVTSEGGPLQIIDLNNLPGTNLSYHNYTGDGPIAGQLTKAHALHIDETKGYLYLYGTNIQGGKPIVLNLNTDPYNPTYAGVFTYGASPYVHDGYVNNDTLFSSHIYDGLFAIVDMSDKNNPVLLGTQNTPNNFTHNTWRYGNTLFATDETSNSFLTAYDISNPANITFLDKIQSNPGTNSIVHNTHIINGYAVTSWYKDGYTIVDVSRPSNLVQVGNYDTYGASGSGFEGCWGVYPFLPSGNILSTNISGEFYVCTPTYQRGCYIEGVVKDAIPPYAPLNNVKVELLTTSTTDNSISNGSYKMGQLNSGVYTLKASKTGYQDYLVNVSLTNGVLTTQYIDLLPIGFPVEMTYFNAIAVEKTAQLEWETANEINCKGFEIQHSTDARNWQNLGFVEPKGGTGIDAVYNFSTDKLPAGPNCFRLKQLDNDSKFVYSDIRVLYMDGEVSGLTVTPNPAKNQIRLYGIDPESITKTEVYNNLGQFQENILSYGNELQWTGLSQGLYRVKVWSDVGEFWTAFVVE